MLENKTIVITGAASGIGRATALAAAKYGALLALCDMNEAGVAETAQMARELGAAAISGRVNVTSAADLEAFMARTGDEYGKIDGALNNAGVGGALTRVHMLTEDLWDQCIDVNLKGVWLSLKYEIPHMRGDGGGRIVATGTHAELLDRDPGYRALVSRADEPDPGAEAGGFDGSAGFDPSGRDRAVDVEGSLR
jgi:NAD(P)-dependent dehydrogenase (short-subunit alcohol dehydrogenase family)